MFLEDYSELIGCGSVRSWRAFPGCSDRDNWRDRKVAGCPADGEIPDGEIRIVSDVRGSFLSE